MSDLRSFAPNLELTASGWWTSPKVSLVDYPEEGNSLCFAVEDSSFWFQHRNRSILEVVTRFPPSGVLFEIGGGNGYVARAIQGLGHDVVLVEPGLVGVQNAVNRGVKHVVLGSFEDLGALGQTLPAVGLFDVLEHIPDDRAMLTEIGRLLVPGGRLYITVPAHNWLWSHEDVLAGHSRRYTISTLTRLLASTGYTIEFSTYCFAFLPLPIFLLRCIPYRLGLASKKPSQESVQSDHKITNPLAARVLAQLTRRELSKIAGQGCRVWGGSCMVVARKRV